MRIPPALPCLLAVLFTVPAAAADEVLVRISAEDCRRLVQHVPAPDVAYRPGVDARGRAVAPADLGGGAQLHLPQGVVVPIEVELARRLGLAEGLPVGEAQLGAVTVRDGTALLNGQPMSDFDRHLVAEACRAGVGR